MDTAPPQIMASRVGVIVSEYTSAKPDVRSILFEHTRPRGDDGTGDDDDPGDDDDFYRRYLSKSAPA